MTSWPGTTKVLETSKFAFALNSLFKASVINDNAVFSESFLPLFKLDKLSFNNPSNLSTSEVFLSLLAIK